MSNAPSEASSRTEAAPGDDHPVVLFDGVCNLCDSTVNLLIDLDPGARLRFASLQSAAARRLLEAHDVVVPQGDPDSVLLVEGGEVLSHSDAVIAIARHLPWPWRALRIGWIVPRPLRDGLYRWVARRRYRWFGREETCRLPSPALRARFIE